ncbi:hypothetical protein CP_0558 [Chlamydia pneumoniae AR39]|uniref:Uncharacterized protein n=1 Tax=Chlamydia pneumoniae TaxID=83558 RepID=Q9K246_CHLPN|nr:hypothetical protein CP_0558 [Chlamydia pneumoniae AR39]
MAIRKESVDQPRTFDKLPAYRILSPLNKVFYKETFILINKR